MTKPVSAQGIAALTEQLSRILHSEGYVEGLYPAQWTALRYFSQALPSSRTTAELARYQGMSLGPVARTVRTLVEKGLLARVANPHSRRADLITVTGSGQKLLTRDPRNRIAAIVETLPDGQKAALAQALEGFVGGLLTVAQGCDYGRGENSRRTADAEPVDTRAAELESELCATP